MAAPVPTLLLRPEGSRDRNGPVSPVITGGVLEVPGKYGSAWQIAEATTNRLTNPSFEEGTSGWLAHGEVTITHDTGEASHGSASAKVVTTAASAGISIPKNLYTVATGDVTTFSIDVKAAEGTPLRLFTAGIQENGITGVSDQNVPHVDFTATGDWQRVSVSVTWTSAELAYLVHRIYTRDANGGEFWVDAGQLEDKGYATPYADGSLGAGHAWTGTLHASASTRENGMVRAYHDLPRDGSGNLTSDVTYAIRVRPQYLTDGYAVIFDPAPGHSGWPNSMQVRTRIAPDRRLTIGAWGYGKTVTTDPLPDPFEEVTIIATGTPDGEMHFWMEGEYLGTKTTQGGVLASSDRLDLWHAAFSEVVVFDRPLTYDERTALVTMPRAWEWDALFPPDHPDLPSYHSRVFLLAPRIYTADRDNGLGSEITRKVTHAAVDADIDRAGPKGQLQIASTDPAVVPANGWIAPFLDVTHEDGTLDSAQMGLYQLDQPEITYDLTGQATATATGVDIVGQLEAWPLGTAQTTAVGANVMQAVRDALDGLGLTRHTLPNDSRTATTTISHGANVSWLARINDLLAAIGYHALYATAEGRLTSRPLRDARQDTPARTYATGRDSAIVDPVTIRRATGNLYNVVVAVKEDFATGTALVAEARNDDPEHPWSTVALGREIAPSQPLVIMEAVDQDALDAIADDKLARASMQETLAMDLLPDPTLAVHDVIEITGTDGPEAGRWSVESLAWGLTADSPLVRLGARRTYTPSSPEGT